TVLAATNQSHAQIPPVVTDTPPSTSTPTFTATATATTGPTATATPIQFTTSNGFCLSAPYNQVIPCPASPVPTRTPVQVTKTLSVSGGTPGPYDTTMYTVTITSSVLCFSLTEPVYLATLGNPDAVAITPILPNYVAPGGNLIPVQLDPATGTAVFSLEVFNKVVGPEGLSVKATWPQEGVERVVNLIPAAPPTATATPLPGASTATPTATAPATPASTTTGTPGTPAAAATPTATTSSQTFFVRACATPNPVAAGSTATLYAQTLPGATCTARIQYNDGSFPSSADFSGDQQTADTSGFVVYPFTANTTATGGSGKVTCTFNGQTETATATFGVTQPTTAVPGSSGAAAAICGTGSGVQVTAAVSASSIKRGSVVTVFGCITSDGKPLSGVPMTAFFNYRTAAQSCSGASDATGVASCSESVPADAPTSPATVSVTFSYNGQRYAAATQFTPY
ncbi:MAG TPA: hypothetical protein VF898_07750, partial [Chloroflexota bacterium]